MPRVRRRPKLRRGWPKGHREQLLTGSTFSDGFGRPDDPRWFFDEEAARRCWDELCDQLMREHLACVDEQAREEGVPPEFGPGTRPWAWWRYDAPEPRMHFDPDRTLAISQADSAEWAKKLNFGINQVWSKRSKERGPRYESQVCYLFRHGFLTAEELDVLEDRQPLLDCTHDDQKNWVFSLSSTPVSAVRERLCLLERGSPPGV
jgi:hypothetical protein